MHHFIFAFFLTLTSLLSGEAVYTIKQPVVTMRQDPNNTSTIASQAIFSEEVTIQKKQGDWILITTPDGYSGWCAADAVVESPQHYNATLKISRLAAHVYSVQDTELGPIITLPYGAKLQLLHAENPRWMQVALPDGQTCFIQKGDVIEESSLSNKSDLVAFSQRFLGLPYTWGGRSSFGYDCSGFVQMLYAKIGINLQRDARQQIFDPRLHVISIEDLQPGDLIFFGASEQKITHVGMYIGNDQFIQASVAENQPWIRISKLNESPWNASASSRYPYRTARQL